MKIRTGFVSNSSSSSFIVKVGEPFDTALEIAKYMIPLREWETDSELVAKVEALEKSGSNPAAVSFRSCNYDTYIAKVDGYFLVETSHHLNLKDVFSFSVPCPAEYAATYGDDGFYNLPQSTDFYSLEYDVTGREMDWDFRDKFEETYCPNCYTGYWMIDGVYQCPNCKTQPKKKKK